MNYAEFRLRIRSTSAACCEVTVEESPDGGATRALRLPRPPPDLARRLAEVYGEMGSREVDLADRKLDQEGAAARATERNCRLTFYRQLQREIGCFLFDLLFQGSVRERLARSLLALRIQGSVGRGATALRVRLILGAPGDSASVHPLAHLAALPWEFLYDPDRGCYLALDEHTPIVRTPDTPGYRPPLEVDPPGNAGLDVGHFHR